MFPPIILFICFTQLFNHIFVNKSDYLIYTSGRLNTPLNVNMNHVVLIQMLSKIRCFSDLKFSKISSVSRLLL